MKTSPLSQLKRALLDVDTAAILGLLAGVFLHMLILFAALMSPVEARAEVGEFRPYGTGGRTQFTVGTGTDVNPTDVIALRTGGLIVATSCNEHSARDWCFTKLNAFGNVDTTWGTNNSGSVMEITPQQDFLRGMFPLADGGWYAFGSCGAQSCLGRYHASGARNTVFGGSGRTTLPGLGILDIEVLADGRIAYAGECFDGGIYRACVGRLLANGNADPTFNNGQALLFALGDTTSNSSYSAHSIKYDARLNRFWVGARCRSSGKYEFCVARVTDSGLLDTSFTASGWYRFAVGAIEDLSHQLLLRPDGYVVLVGQCRTSAVDPFVSAYCAAEVLPWAPALNQAFGTNGTRVFAVQIDAIHLIDNRSAFLQSDGSLGIVGSCRQRNSVDKLCLALLASNGSDDLRLRPVRAVQSIAAADTVANRLAGSSRVMRGFGDVRTIYAFASCGLTGSGVPCIGLFEWATPRGGECTLDLDGDGRVLATTDGAILTRIGSGFRGQTALNGVAGPGVRQAWEAIQHLLERDCGMALSQ